MILLDDDKKAERRRICGDCEHRKQRPAVPPYCGLCGCFIETKTLVARSACPAGKWAKVG